MSPDEMRRAEIAEAGLVQTARAMLDGSLGMIEGVRQITRLRYGTTDPDDPIYDPIVAAESETDHLPVGRERMHWSHDVLPEKDRELEKYIAAAREYILDACEAIIARYAKREHQE